MRDTTKDLDVDQLADVLGVIILEHQGGEKGRYYGDGVISLRAGLGHINRRCTLAHELAHHLLQHDPAATGWLRNRQEAQADKTAVELLIDIDEYREAEAICGPHNGAIAAELNVTTKTISSWQKYHDAHRVKEPQ